MSKKEAEKHHITFSKHQIGNELVLGRILCDGKVVGEVIEYIGYAQSIAPASAVRQVYAVLFYYPEYRQAHFTNVAEVLDDVEEYISDFALLRGEVNDD